MKAGSPVQMPSSLWHEHHGVNMLGNVCAIDRASLKALMDTGGLASVSADCMNWWPCKDHDRRKKERRPTCARASAGNRTEGGEKPDEDL